MRYELKNYRYTSSRTLGLRSWTAVLYESDRPVAAVAYSIDLEPRFALVWISPYHLAEQERELIDWHRSIEGEHEILGKSRPTDLPLIYLRQIAHRNVRSRSWIVYRADDKIIRSLKGSAEDKGLLIALERRYNGLEIWDRNWSDWRPVLEMIAEGV